MDAIPPTCRDAVVRFAYTTLARARLRRRKLLVQQIISAASKIESTFRMYVVKQAFQTEMTKRRRRRHEVQLRAFLSFRVQESLFTHIPKKRQQEQFDTVLRSLMLKGSGMDYSRALQEASRMMSTGASRSKPTKQPTHPSRIRDRLYADCCMSRHTRDLTLDETSDESDNSIDEAVVRL